MAKKKTAKTTKKTRGKGRPTKFNDDRIHTLLAAIKDGLYIEQACDYAGIARETYYDWMKKGEAGEQPFASFSDSIKKVQADSELEAIQKIRRDKSWQSKAWYLERKNHNRWGRKETVRIEKAENEELSDLVK